MIRIARTIADSPEITGHCQPSCGIPAAIAEYGRGVPAYPIIVLDAGSGQTLDSRNDTKRIDELRKEPKNRLIFLLDRGGLAPDVDDQIKAKQLTSEQAAAAKAAETKLRQNMRPTRTHRSTLTLVC